MMVNKKNIKANIEKTFILTKSLEIIIEDGYQSLSMRKIGKSCDFSHAKIYYYFSNKEEILLELVALGFVELRKSTVKALEGKLSPREAFIIMVEQLYRFGIENPNYFNLMFSFDTPKGKELIISKVDSVVIDGLTKQELEYYNIFKLITKNYTNIEEGKDNGKEQITNIFIQIAGIIWLENTKILSGFEINSRSLFDSTVERILSEIDNKI